MEENILKISGNTKVYTVIGNPIHHSKSPNMHNAAFGKLGINACYVPLAPNENEVGHICDLVRSNVISGSNVTIPYKEEVIKYIDVLTDEAKLIGSVNTLYSIDNKLHGHNTDGLGFSRSLFIDNNFEPAEKKAIVLGAGGASKAICSKLCSNKISSLLIFDIDHEKALELKEHLESFNFKTDIKIISQNEVDQISQESDLIVNCTPIGMKESDPELINSDCFKKTQFVYDLIYSPSKTKLLMSAETKGAKIINGLDMLAYQGAESFSLWEKVDPPYEIMSQELRYGK